MKRKGKTFTKSDLIMHRREGAQFGLLAGASVGAALAHPASRKALTTPIGKTLRDVGRKLKIYKDPMSKRRSKDIDAILDVYSRKYKHAKGSAKKRKEIAKQHIKKVFRLRNKDLEKFGSLNKKGIFFVAETSGIQRELSDIKMKKIMDESAARSAKAHKEKTDKNKQEIKDWSDRQTTNEPFELEPHDHEAYKARWDSLTKAEQEKINKKLDVNMYNKSIAESTLVNISNPLIKQNSLQKLGFFPPIPIFINTPGMYDLPYLNKDEFVNKSEIEETEENILERKKKKELEEETKKNKKEIEEYTKNQKPSEDDLFKVEGDRYHEQMDSLMNLKDLNFNYTEPIDSTYVDTRGTRK